MARDRSVPNFAADSLHEMVSRRGLDRDKLLPDKGECSVDTQSTMRLYPRAQRLLATCPLPKRLAFPNVNSNKELSTAKK
eukprot:bmy_22299T0